MNRAGGGRGGWRVYKFQDSHSTIQGETVTTFYRIHFGYCQGTVGISVTR